MVPIKMVLYAIQQCLMDLQAKTDTTVDGLKGELQQAKAAATTAGAENLSLEIRIGNQQREYRRSLRQAQVCLS